MGSKVFSLITLAVLFMLLSSCEEYSGERIDWSPDGSSALVGMADNSLYIIEGSKLVPRSLGISAVDMEWLPDGRHAVVATLVEHIDWQSLKTDLNAEQIKEVTSEAEFMLKLILDSNLSFSDIEPEDTPSGDASIVQAALLYIRHSTSEEIKSKLNKDWSNIEALTAYTCRLVMIDTLENSLTTPSLLYAFPKDESQDLIICIDVDPTGRLVAVQWAKETDDFKGYIISICDIKNPGYFAKVADSTGYHLAWNPDGRLLAFYSSADNPFDEHGSMLRTDTLEIRDISFNEEGKLKNFFNKKCEIRILFYPYADLEFAPDGSLYFTTMDISLPATEDEMDKDWTVFHWEPGAPEKVGKVFDQNKATWFSEPTDGIWNIELSPGGNRLLMQGENELYVYDTKSGKHLVIPEVDFEKMGSLPHWRNDEEFAVIYEDIKMGNKTERDEILLLHLNDNLIIDSTTCLSRNWPDEMVEGWFETKK